MTHKPPQEVFDLYDKFAHGLITKRTFMKRLGAFAVGGVTVAALADSVLPNYALAEQVAPTDPRIIGDDRLYPSPKGAGEMMGYFVTPSNDNPKKRQDGVFGNPPLIIVIHENRGLNPYIRDVARRLAVEGYTAFAPDALYPFGGYPGDDDTGRELQRQRDRAEMLEDFKAAVEYWSQSKSGSPVVGCVGFCFGGYVSNWLAAHVPTLKAAVPFYGSGVTDDEVKKINAPLLIHLGGLDERVNAGWPAYETALQAVGVEYTMHMYEGANHGFHNDTTPRYDAAAASLAWERTLAFFEEHLTDK